MSELLSDGAGSVLQVGGYMIGFEQSRLTYSCVDSEEPKNPKLEGV